MTEAERAEIKSSYYGTLNDKLSGMTLYSPPPTNLQGRWGDLVEPQARVTTWDTGVPVQLLQFVGAKSVDIPEQICLHNHLLKTHVQVQQGSRPEGLVLPSQAERCRLVFFLNSGSVAKVGGGNQAGLVDGGGPGFRLFALPGCVCLHSVSL